MFEVGAFELSDIEENNEGISFPLDFSVLCFNFIPKFNEPFILYIHSKYSFLSSYFRLAILNEIGINQLILIIMITYMLDHY